MKSMTCQQLGGACDHVFTAETFDEMAEQSKAHAMQMLQSNDQPHLDAMQAMKDLMQKEGAMQAWFEAKRAEFTALPDD